MNKGAKNIAVVRTDNSGTVNLERYVKSVVAGRGGQLKDVIVPAGTVDFAPIVAASTEGEDGVVLMTDLNTTSQYLQEARASGVDLNSKVKVVAPPAVVAAATLQSGVADGMYLSDPFPADHSGLTSVDNAYSDIRAQPQYNTADTVSINAYFGLLTFADVAKGLTTFDGTSVLAALNKASNVQVGGRTLDFTKQNTRPGLNRIFNTQVFTFRVSGGKIKSLSTTPINGLPGAS
jgi:ABC-type branched-subunit amino acid transport system substrate-binding protein